MWSFGVGVGFGGWRRVAYVMSLGHLVKQRTATLEMKALRPWIMKLFCRCLTTAHGSSLQLSIMCWALSYVLYMYWLLPLYEVGWVLVLLFFFNEETEAQRGEMPQSTHQVNSGVRLLTHRITRAWVPDHCSILLPLPSVWLFCR